MAGIKISALPAVASALTTDIFPVVQAGVTSQESILQVRTLFGFDSSTGLLAMNKGGTNAALTAAIGALPYSTSTAFALLANPAAAGKVLQSGNAAAPTWSTPTYPSASGTAGKVLASDGTNIVYSTATFPVVGGTAGNVLISNGTNYVASTSLWPNTVGTAGKIIRSDGTTNAYTTSTFADTYAVSTILYASASNTVTGMAAAQNGVLVSGNTNVPSMLAGPGSSGNVLQSNAAAAPSFSTAQYPSAAGTSGNVITSGGTNFSSATLTSVMDVGLGSTRGNILYRNATVWTVLAPGTAGFVLQSGGAGADPSWTNIEGVSVVPTKQVFLSGSGTYTTPAGVFYLKVSCVGGGGGGGGSCTIAANDGGAGGTGGDSTFSTLTAQGGVGGSNSATLTGGTGGGGVNGDVNLLGSNGGTGSIGGTPSGVTFMGGSGGGSAFFGGGGLGSNQITGHGVDGVANTGGGGSGALNNFASGKSGTAGGGGGSLWKIISSPAATYSYAVGAGGTAGAAGTSGYVGGAGGSGIIIVEEFYQ